MIPALLRPLLSGLLCLTAPLLSAEEAPVDPIVTYRVEGSFREVSGSVRSAILGQGIHIAHVLPAGEMLARTGPAFGHDEPVYRHAETYEFCSARLSHELSRTNPDNIVLCPFTISVYELAAEPGVIRISYRRPQGRPGTETVRRRIVELIETIIEEATW